MREKMAGWEKLGLCFPQTMMKEQALAM